MSRTGDKHAQQWSLKLDVIFCKVVHIYTFLWTLSVVILRSSLQASCEPCALCVFLCNNMPDASAQTHMTAVEEVGGEFRFEWISIQRDIEMGASAEGETNLSNKNNWPAFPPDYWKELHAAHHRWGGSKSQKYEILPYLGDNEMLGDWCLCRFAERLQVRKLQEFIALVGRCRWVWHGSRRTNGCIAFSYVYDPPTSERQRSHLGDAHTRPVMREALRSHEFNTDTITTYHGTTIPALARILHTHEMLESRSRYHGMLEVEPPYTFFYGGPPRLRFSRFIIPC